jgi:8-amino-7-oxononanoate synthase
MFHVTHTARPLPFLAAALEALRARDLLRVPRTDDSLLGFASNDYLGLARSSETPWGATGSRLISGNHEAMRALERELARWLELPAALVFTSGYAANVGALSALLGPEDVVCSDALNHASLIDGIRLSRAKVRVFPHDDLEALALCLAEAEGARRVWVVTESYFSMDADGPDLVQLRALCDRAGAYLYLDEAHALGVFGPSGRGLAAAAGIVPDVFAATLGKSLGAQGAFVAGAPELYDFLWNKARSFVFSTGLSPAVAAVAMLNVARVESAESQRRALEGRVARFRRQLRSSGLEPLGHGPIVPVVFGDEASALAIGSRLEARGFHVQPIRPPTVAPGTSRVRITLSTYETDAQVDALAVALLEETRS